MKQMQQKKKLYRNGQLVGRNGQLVGINGFHVGFSGTVVLSWPVVRFSYIQHGLTLFYCWSDFDVWCSSQKFWNIDFLDFKNKFPIDLGNCLIISCFWNFSPHCQFNCFKCCQHDFCLKNRVIKKTQKSLKPFDCLCSQ